MVLEKSTEENRFYAIKEIRINNPAELNFTYIDPETTSANVYYRLLLILASGQAYYSKVVLLSTYNQPVQTGISFSSTGIKTDLTFNITSAYKAQGTLQLISYTGRRLYRQSINVLPGNNILRITGSAQLPSGYYIAIMEIGNKQATQKIFKP